MHASDDTARPVMFSGTARSRWVRDAAAVALCFSLIGGFVAHAAAPAPAPAPARQGALIATSSVAQPGCPEVRVQ